MKPNFMKFALGAAMAAGMAFAQTPATPATPANPGNQAVTGHFGRHHRFARQKMAQALNLTDAQKAQAKTIFQQARESAKPLRDQLKQNREALAQAVKANDVAQIQQLSTEQGNLRGKVTAIRAEAMAKVYQTLTPEQRTKADQLHQKMQERMKQRSERMSQRRNNG